ncbi:hypothetical protein ACJJTC_009977 [Scirpophaga incertulas]
MLERRKFRNKRDDNSKDKYRKLTNRITVKCREAKITDVETTCNKIEELIKKGKMNQAYNIIRQLNIKHKRKSTAILNEEGRILVDNKDIVNRWKMYMEDLYDGDGLTEQDIEAEDDGKFSWA